MKNWIWQFSFSRHSEISMCISMHAWKQTDYISGNKHSVNECLAVALCSVLIQPMSSQLA